MEGCCFVVEGDLLILLLVVRSLVWWINRLDKVGIC